MTQKTSGDDRITALAFVGVVVFAGINAVAVRQSNAELAPFWGAFLRFGVATLLFAVLAVLWRVPFPHGRALVGAVLYGLFNFGIAYALLYFALQDASAGVGQVALALIPLVTIPLAVLHRLERLRLRVLAGAIIATGGILIVFADQLSLAVPLVSLLALVLASVSAAEGVIIPKAFPRTIRSRPTLWAWASEPLSSSLSRS
jgi:drug/metabolite transporter (DMT)-like permease